MGHCWFLVLQSLLFLVGRLLVEELCRKVSTTRSLDLVCGTCQCFLSFRPSLGGSQCHHGNSGDMDHGVALSAGSFYLDTCGWPSKNVWAIGLTGIACLAVCNSTEAYAILHSCWHFLSAAAASTLWAVDGHGRLEQRKLKAQRIMTLLHLYNVK
jgi:hypothetical protein